MHNFKCNKRKENVLNSAEAEYERERQKKGQQLKHKLK